MSYRDIVIRVGLTGGIGSGKTTVAAMLRQRGAVVIERPDLLSKAERAGLRLLERHADGSSTTFTPESQRHVSVYRPS